MIHPDDSDLLAYIRQQPSGTNLPSIHQHIAGCVECQLRYRELKQTSEFLEEALLRPSAYALPQSNAADEWDWVQDPAAAQHAYQRRRQERVGEDLALGVAVLTHLPLVLRMKVMSALIPYTQRLKGKPHISRNSVIVSTRAIGVLVAVFLMFLTMVLAVVAYALTGHGLFKLPPLSGVPTAGAQITVVLPHQQQTPMPSKLGAMPTVTATSSGSKPTIAFCVNGTDKRPNRLQVCGRDFRPGDKVELMITTASGQPKVLHPVPVDAAGKFQVAWFYDCKDVPVAIFAQDVAYPAIVSQTLGNIPAGKCSSTTTANVGAGH